MRTVPNSRPEHKHHSLAPGELRVPRIRPPSERPSVAFAASLRTMPTAHLCALGRAVAFAKQANPDAAIARVAELLGAELLRRCATAEVV
jgi:hypothetical protein